MLNLRYIVKLYIFMKKNKRILKIVVKKLKNRIKMDNILWKVKYYIVV